MARRSTTGSGTRAQQPVRATGSPAFDVPDESEHLGQVGTTWCPRCGADLIAPSAFDSAWRCGTHGKTLPLSVFQRLEENTITHIRSHAEVPLWLPDPMPLGWQLSGLAAVGDSRSRYRATVAAFRGPAPLGGTGEWLIVAEEPAIGLGAGYAGGGADTPQHAAGSQTAAKILVRGHLSSIWPVPDTASDRSAYVGEAAGVWLWLIGLPADAGYAVLENLAISDLRHRHVRTAPPAARSRWLRPGWPASDPDAATGEPDGQGPQPGPADPAGEAGVDATESCHGGSAGPPDATDEDDPQR